MMNVKTDMGDGYDYTGTQYNPSSSSYVQYNQPSMEDSDDNSGMNITQTPNGGGACFCGKVFSTYNYCRVHYIQMHGEDTADDKALVCLICQHPFAYDLNLKNHLKKEHAISGKLTLAEGSEGQIAVTESGGGVCLVCSKKFSTLNYCKVHFRSKHEAPINDEQEGIMSPVTDQQYLEYQTMAFPTTFSDHRKEDIMNESPYRQIARTNMPQNSDQKSTTNVKYTKTDSFSETNSLQNYNIKEEYLELTGTVDYSGNQQEHGTAYAVSQQNQSGHLSPINKHQNNLKRSLAEPTIGEQVNKVIMKREVIQRNSPCKSEGDIKVSKTPSGGGYCEVCGKTYSRIDTARSHYVQVHGEATGNKKAFCLICNEGFVFEQNLSSHLKQEHAIVGRLQLYEGCGGKLAKTESGGGVCLVCGAKYSRMDTLKSHFKTKHEHLSSEESSPVKKSRTELFENPNQLGSYQSERYSTNMGTSQNCSNSPGFIAGALKKERVEGPQDQSIYHNTNEAFPLKEETCIPTTPLIRPIDVNLLKAKSVTSSVNVKQENRCNSEDTNQDNMVKISATESGGGICLICHTTFSLYGNCKAHYIKKHGEDDGQGSHLCLICERTFNFHQNRKDHLKSEHGVNGELERFQEYGDGYYMAKMGTDGGVCLKCRHVFTLFGNLKAHYSKKHGNQQIVLDNKSAISSTTHNSFVPKSTQLHSTSSLSTSALASGSYSCKRETSFSFKQNSPNPSIPEINNIETSPRKNLRFNLEDEPEMKIEKTDSGGGRCLVCNMAFSQYGNCKVHYVKKHGEDGTGHLHCLMCQAQFNFRSSFKEHMSGKHGVTGNLQRCHDYGEGEMMAKDDKGGGACLMCSKYFSQFGNLKVHFNKKHAHS